MPAKNLKAIETSREMKCRQKPSSVVARLMGVEPLPMPPSVLTARKKTHSSYLNLETDEHCQWPEDADEVAGFKHVFETGEQPFMSTSYEPNEVYDEKCFQKRMSLVQQKFSDAKRIAMDKNPLQSQEFQDAIAFLSSNRELFLKFLTEPNSLFSEHRRGGAKSSSLLSQTKRITLLKPSISSAEEDNEDLGDKSDEEPSRHCWSSGLPTRIVVLKPSPQAEQRINRKEEPQTISPKAKSPSSRGAFGTTRADEIVETRKVAKEITRHLRETLSGHQTDNDLLFSALTNGYVGDESSSNRSESDDMEKESGSLSDSEMVTATSTHSGDYTNMPGSPNSFSSFSRASYSPESYVIKEAKKRLAHRLASVNAHVNSHDHRSERSSFGTLAEMLALSEANKGEARKVSIGRLFNEERNLAMELQRSKSVPASFSTYEATRNGPSLSSLINSPFAKKDVAKSIKSAFKGKVSSFFFSKSKKKNREISDCRQHPSSFEACNDEGLTKFASDSQLSERKTNYDNRIVTSSFTTPLSDRSNQDAADSRHRRKPERCTEKHEQLVLVSVCNKPFNDLTNTSLFHLSENTTLAHPQALGRSPPIESVARSLSIASSSETTKPVKISSIFCKAEEEREQFLFIKRLLSSAKFDTRSGLTTYAKWHSSESPLNPLLLDEQLIVNDNEVTGTLTHSLKQLLFDCINALLLDISQRTTLAAYPWANACGRANENGPGDTPLAEEVWQSISSWNSCGKCMSGESNRSINEFIDRLVRTEASEWQPAEWVWLEMYEFSKDIGGKILEELVEESLSELSGW